MLGTFKISRIIATLCVIGAIARSQYHASNLRLPTNFKPNSYELRVTTRLEDEFIFKGHVRININCTETTDTVVLHSSNLFVDKNRTTVRAVNLATAIDVPVNVTFDRKNDFLLIKRSDFFESGEEYELSIPFNGTIADGLIGYFRSSYLDAETNQTRWLAVTHFQPNYARRAFPCFDEPEYKAKFKIILIHDKCLWAASNTRLVTTTPAISEPGYVEDEFEESLPMSTYTVAWAVSDFGIAESNKTANGEAKFRVLYRKDVVNTLSYVNTRGRNISEYFEEYFGEKSPLSKQDSIVVPDFLFGAMENWGLITYSESVLRGTTNAKGLEKAVRVIAHELAHNWFGNLVTMKWWNDLWLNEGFAKYFEARGFDHIFPDANYAETATVGQFLTVLDVDALESSHPVSAQTKGRSGEIRQITRSHKITYQKGSLLLHMMNKFLGEETFKQGLRHYVQRHKYSNVEQDDFWRAMTEVAHRTESLNKNVTVKEIMDTWTLQTGYPVLKVVRDYSSGEVTVSQERFLKSNSSRNSRKTTGAGCWWIPLTMTSSSEANFKETKATEWLNCKTSNYTWSLKGDDDWVIINVQMAGLFRVLYDKRNWEAISDTLNHPSEYQKIHVLNRVQLINDAFAFSATGAIDYEITFKMLECLRHEESDIVWNAAWDGLLNLKKLLDGTPIQGLFDSYIKRVLSYSLSNNNGSSITTQDNSNLTLFDKDYFKNWCQTIFVNSREEWDRVWNTYLLSHDSLNRSYIRLKLACTSNQWLLNRYLNRTIGETATVRKQDALDVFSLLIYNDVGFNVAKDFLFKRIKDIYLYFHLLDGVVGQYVESIGSKMKSKEELKELRAFVNESDTYLREFDFIVNQTIETIEINMEWNSTSYNRLANYFKCYNVTNQS